MTAVEGAVALPRDRRARMDLRWTHVDDHYIDGAWRTSSTAARLPVVDPATEEVWGSAPDADPADLDAAMTAAHRAFSTGPWRSTTAKDRAVLLLRMADEVEARADLLSRTTTRENGSPVAETVGSAANAAGILRYFASLAFLVDHVDLRPAPDGSFETLVCREPLGVCALIAPWNFPINLVVIKLAPALLAGNTVVIKPAPSTPLSIRYIVEAAEAAELPPGAVNLVTGGTDCGDALVRHPLTAKVAFTGSTPVGRRIAASCGELLRPVTLELGGKSSAVVMPDADLSAVAGALLRCSMRNSGQTCYTASRILAPAERYDEVVDIVTATVAAARVGDPFDSATVIGPVATAAQQTKVLDLIETARREGARLTTGGTAVDRPGYYVAPTVIADVQADSTVAQEEIFGPVVTVTRYDGVDHAVAIANGTAFGLGGVVFGADSDAALAVAQRMDTGSVGLNFFASNHAAPFAGRHDSGLGVEYGPEGLGAYLAYKSVHRRLEACRGTPRSATTP